MSIDANQLSEITLRQEMHAFWDDVIEVAQPSKGRFAMAVPLCYPDGWQVVLSLSRPVPGFVRISDEGRTLKWLSNRGQNIESRKVAKLLEERLNCYEIEADGFELFQHVPSPLSGATLQLFGEALVSISHLFYLYEPVVTEASVARDAVEKIFAEQQIEPLRNHALSGRIENRVIVDYYFGSENPSAIEIFQRKRNVRPLMEQWGFRWNDLRKEDSRLKTAMVYDPGNQDIDRQSLRIGEDICDLFCPYFETDRINEFVSLAR